MADWILKHVMGESEEQKRWEMEMAEDLGLALLHFDYTGMTKDNGSLVWRFLQDFPQFCQANGVTRMGRPKVKFIDCHKVPRDQLEDSQGVVWYLEITVNDNPQRMEITRVDPDARQVHLPVHHDLAWSPT
ncbi:hypothetical protein KKC88_06345 [Patescibacteria group bacterium]|nr:hypothetical protein [Patescibacteria group bacterium]MBU1673898.1 hypothetical protein [Patescibacteria group bacterium]MBU1963429.1 hypothetical protein [Patescibacteria group bacterium]